MKYLISLMVLCGFTVVACGDDNPTGGSTADPKEKTPWEERYGERVAPVGPVGEYWVVCDVENSRSCIEDHGHKDAIVCYPLGWEGAEGRCVGLCEGGDCVPDGGDFRCPLGFCFGADSRWYWEQDCATDDECLPGYRCLDTSGHDGKECVQPCENDGECSHMIRPNSSTATCSGRFTDGSFCE